ncbi:MAG: hypothetical protein ACXQS8_04625 [Candidatus Helarchaeales archaeon]
MKSVCLFLEYDKENSDLNQFLNYFIDEIETDLLIEFFREFELSKGPTPKDIKAYELKKRRAPKKARFRYQQKDPLRKNEIIQEILYIKSELNEDKMDMGFIDEGFSISNNAAIELKDGSDTEDTGEVLISYKKRKTRKHINHSNIEEVNVRRVTNKAEIPDLNDNEINEIHLGDDEPDKYHITFYVADSVKKLITRDWAHMMFLGKIEESLYEFYRSHPNNYHCQLYLEQDFEIPEINKLILYIRVGGLSIDEKLDLWDELDCFIREEIGYLAGIFEKKSQKFQEINQNFYTNIELD